MSHLGHSVTCCGADGKCQKESPRAPTFVGCVRMARKAGWRVWGKADPSLPPGYAACPKHAKARP